MHKKSEMNMLRRLLGIFLLVLVSLPALAGGKLQLTENADEEAEFLSPDAAFSLVLAAQDDHTIRADFKVAPGYYLYKDRIKFELANTQTGKITQVDLPAGEIKDDPNFGKMEVYHHDFNATVVTQGAAGDITVNARYQGCSEKGLCYAPQRKSYQITLANAVTDTKTVTDIPAASVSGASDDQATTLLKGGKLWLIAIGFFGFGLLLALTPCVLPMIPILSGIIVGDEKAHHHATSRMHSFNLSLAYTMGMALSYTLAGIAAGLSGQLLSNALQNPWVLGATALIFVALAFSMFGFYELRLPHAIEERMVNTTNKLKGGQFLGVFLMGVLSALIVSPCVAAPLAGALLYISQTHDVVLGGLALFCLSLGMGVPLLLIGASAGHVLPKAGPWMTAVRNFFGVIMLAVAIYLVSPVIPSALQMLLWAALFIIPAMYLHALDPLPIDEKLGRSHPWMRFLKGIGIILLGVCLALLVGALSGAKSPWQPLAGLRQASAESTSALPFKRVRNTAELEQAIKQAAGKFVMLDFYADWCVSCQEMEQLSFSDSRVKKALNEFVLLQADVTENTPEDLGMLQRFSLFGPPGIIFFNKNGQEIRPVRVIGFEEAESFLATIHRVKTLKADECNPLIVC